MRSPRATLAGRRRLRARGRTLVEVMVALLLGLILIAAICALYLGTWRSNRLQDSVRSADDNARWALEVIGSQVRMAGLGTANLAKRWARPVDFTGFPVKGCEGGFGATPDSCAARSTTAMDAMIVRYMPVDRSAATLTDCNNKAIPATRTMAENAIYVRNGNLVCRGSDLAAGGTEEVLANNVADFQLWYGVAPDALTGNVQRIDRAGSPNLGTDLDWERVVSVQVCLIVFDTRATAQDVSGSYMNCEGQTVTTNDGRVRRRYVSNFSLRNRVA